MTAGEEVTAVLLIAVEQRLKISNNKTETLETIVDKY
tara:strand:+ start:2787 stop:2897 length:111 start_codon:yes stop_codon:yes gene_type:complete